MMLYQWRGAARNFGDELNALLWPRLLPGFFNDDPGVRFLGIGSVLDARHARQGLKLVAGSGYGGYQAPPVLDQDWIIRWVRGPRTARRLGLPLALGLGDPAVLVPLAGFRAAARQTGIGFMPHFESALRGAWAPACQAAGVTLIDPRDDPAAIIAAIGQCRLVLSEALHGVIVADALRVPWIPIEPRAAVHHAKWLDWADSLGITIRFQTLPPSSAAEWAHGSILSRFHAGRCWLDHQTAHLNSIATRRLVSRAAEALGRAATATPRLSDGATLARTQSRMLDHVAALRRDPFTAAIAA